LVDPYGPRAMPMEFLTDAQVAGYGRFDGVPSRADLERFFFLDDADKDLLGDRRGDQNRLGLMLQATTVRYVGRFVEDPLDVPWPVVEYLAGQLRLPVCPDHRLPPAGPLRPARGYRRRAPPPPGRPAGSVSSTNSAHKPRGLRPPHAGRGPGPQPAILLGFDRGGSHPRRPGSAAPGGRPALPPGREPGPSVHVALCDVAVADRSTLDGAHGAA
jgi:Domain of unknown function (DUF4158)